MKSLRWALLVISALCCLPSASSATGVTYFRRFPSYTSPNGYCSTVGIAREWYGTPSACTVFPIETDWPKARAMWFSAEGFIPTTAVKNPAVTANGSALVFNRSITPPDHDANCLSGVDLYDEGTHAQKDQSCFLWMSGLNGTCSGGSGTGPTILTPQQRNAYSCNTNADCISGTCSATIQCYAGSNPGAYCKRDADCTGGGYCPVDVCRDWGRQTGPLRGTLSGDTLRGEVADMAASIQAARPGAQLPVFILSMRYDMVTPFELQLQGFDPAWLMTPGVPAHASPNGDVWQDFYGWLTSDSSSLCSSANTDCSADDVGKLGTPNNGCVDATGGGNGWQNGLTSNCTWTYSYSGGVKSFFHNAQGAWTGGGWDRKDAGFSFGDLVDLVGGSRTNVIYYVTRPTGSHWAPQGVMTKQNAAGYVEWRAALSKKLVDEIKTSTPDAVVMVQLNHKMSQLWNGYKTYSWYMRDTVSKYDGDCKRCNGGARAGLYCTSGSACSGGTCDVAITAAACVSAGGTCTNSEVCVGGTSGGLSCKDGVVQPSEVVCDGDGGYTGNQDSGGDTQAEWVMGWWKLGRALHAAGVKYSPWVGVGPFFFGKTCRGGTAYGAGWNSASCTVDANCSGDAKCSLAYDDPRTTTIDEQALIKETVYNSDLVMTTDKDGDYGGVDTAGTGCSGGETGAALIECSTNCKNKTGMYLLQCVLAARNTPWIYTAGGSDPNGTCALK